MKIIKQNLEAEIYNIKTKNWYIEWYIEWYKNNKLHREDGPTSIWSDGDEFYYLNNIEYLEDEYWKKVHANY